MSSTFARYAGLIWAPFLWAANTQVGLILPHVDCRQHVFLTATVAWVAVALALGSASLSYAMRGATPSRLQIFLGWMSVLTGLVFALALAYQGAASLLLNACDR
jgi:hypothetical protein